MLGEDNLLFRVLRLELRHRLFQPMARL